MNSLPTGETMIVYFPLTYTSRSPTNFNQLRQVRLEDIPEEYHDIADELGMDTFLRLAYLCSGQCLYIPKRESLERSARNREIRARFNGGNYRALALQYRLSERQIRKIVNGMRI